MPENRRIWLSFFAGELRHWRELRGMTQEQLASAVDYSPSTVAMVETCGRKPKPDFVRRCDEALDTGGALMRLLEEIVDREVVPDWLDRWRRIEAEATALDSFQLFAVPGLLQTPEYARAIFRAGSPASADVEDQVAARLERQRILTRDDPPMLVAVLDENVLRRPIGGSKVMRDQLTRLVELAELPNLFLHVVRNETGAYAGLTGPFAIALLDGQETVYQEGALRGVVLEHADDVAAFKRLWEGLRSEALPLTASLELIKEAAEQWS